MEDSTKEFYQKLGRRIHCRRKHRGLSETALAELVGVTRKSIQKIEQGHPTSFYNGLRLLKVLRINLKDLEPNAVSLVLTQDG